MLAAAAVALVLAGARLALPIVRHDTASSPIAALAATPPALRAEPVLNGYGFGGYLIGAGVRPFVDGRADMYGDAFLDLYGKIAAGDRAAFDEALARWPIAWTIFAPSEPIVAVMDREPGWRASRRQVRRRPCARRRARGGGVARGELSGGARVTLPSPRWANAKDCLASRSVTGLSALPAAIAK